MIVICDKAQDIVIPAGLGDNAGVVYEKSGVESLNGQQGDLTLKTVNGNELLGEGDVAIDTGVESLNGQTGAVKIKSVNGQSLVGDGDVQIQAGLKYFELTADKAKEAYEEVINHWDSLSGYTGDYVFTYNNRKGNIANYYFVKITHIDDATGNYVLFSCVDTDAGFNYRDSKIKIFSVIVYNNNNGANYNLRTYYNTFTIPDKTSQLVNDAGFQDELGVVTTIDKYQFYSKTYFFFNDPTRDPNAPNAHNINVFNAFEAAIADNVMSGNFFIVNGSAESGQTPYCPILQVLRKEEVENGVWGGNKGYYVFAGQKNSESTDKFQVHMYCLTDIGGVIDYGVNALDGGTWTSGVHSKIDDVLTAGADIPCTFEYLEGCDETYFWADNMGGKQGLYNISFNGGYDGYKGNVVADVYGNDTGVYMAFTVNNVRYTYKKNDTSNKWELTKSVQIGGVQSTEVSNIKVLTQSEYDALEPKDPNTMYCIKG